MSFLNEDENAQGGAAGKLLALAVVLLIAGGAAYWFLGRSAPEEPEPQVEESAPVVEAEPEPVESEPEPAPRDVPSTGSLRVTSDETGAEVFLDGERVGTTPYEDPDIHIGDYEVRVSLDGYVDYTESVRVRPGREASLRARMERVPPSLRVESDVPGATVFVDRNYKGTTPVDIVDLTPGEHQLTVSAEGYDIQARTVNVTTGRQEIRIEFEQAVAEFRQSIAVIHKHRFGECEGQLVADAAGLRYETDHKDAFATAFGQLERFDVDYIEKNLNVKVAGGKNYNFTEKSGNADALFVFQKDVQEFREKQK